MDKNVIVMTPNGRRQTVKVTPNTTLLQILEEACQKHGFDSENYCLKHHNKEVGLTQMFRFSGLPNNCLLEMSQTDRKRVTTNVNICVQLENGARIQGKFQPQDNLWQVVEKLIADEAVKYESPVVIYMRQEIIGRERIRETSLKSLGIIEGSAMIRFINKTPEELKTQANVYIAPTVKETPTADEKPRGSRGKTQGSDSSQAGGFAITKELVQTLKKTADDNDELAKKETNDNDTTSNNETGEKPKFDWDAGVGRSMRNPEATAEQTEKDLMEAEAELEGEVIIIGERSALLYSLEGARSHLEELPDSFFDLTVHDLRFTILRDLKKAASGNEDAPLLTEKMREMEKNKMMLNKMAQYKNCIIRVKFPDRYVLQGTFKPVDNITEVVGFVRKFLQNPDTNFYLFTIPPKTVLPLDKTLLELDLVPNALLQFGSDSDNPSPDANFVKSEFLDKLSTVEGAFFAAKKFRITNPKHTFEESNNENDSFVQYENKQPDASTGAIPKRPRNNTSQST